MFGDSKAKRSWIVVSPATLEQPEELFITGSASVVSPDWTDDRFLAFRFKTKRDADSFAIPLSKMYSPWIRSEKYLR